MEYYRLLLRRTRRYRRYYVCLPVALFFFLFVASRYDALFQFGRESFVGLTEEHGRFVSHDEHSNDNDLLDGTPDDVPSFLRRTDEGNKNSNGKEDDYKELSKSSGVVVSNKIDKDYKESKVEGDRKEEEKNTRISSGAYVNINNVRALLALSPEPNAGVHLVEARLDQKSLLDEKQYAALMKLLDYVRRDDFYLLDKCPSSASSSSSSAYWVPCECPYGYMGMDCSIKSLYLHQMTSYI